MDKIIMTEADRLLLVKDKSGYRFPTEEEVALPEKEEIYSFPGYKAFPIRESGAHLAEREVVGLRESWNLLSPEEYAAASKGAELLNWSRATLYCSADGSPLRRGGEISKICPKCGKEYFPALWPAVVVLVIKGDEALLVHARTLRRPGVQTLVAGFVETGESLEECVRREIREETSLEVDDVRYYGSQSWPFPHQLMVGFTARYKSGSIRFADGELTSGGFFRRDSLPELPTMPSLSRMIINDWIEGKI